MKQIFTILSLLFFSVSNAQNAALVWAKQLGSSSNEQGKSVAVDATGNVHTAGSFFATGDFNPDPAVTNNLSTSGSGNDVFVSKLNTSGNYVWAKQLGGNSPDEGYAIAVDVTGNVYTTGVFAGTADFNPDPAATFNLTASATDVFISKLDASGNFVWAKQFTAASGATGSSVKVDVLGNVYATGSFSGVVDFNPDPVIANNLTSAGSADIFIVKLDASGNYVWAKRIGSTSNDVGTSLVVDALSNVFTTGYFGGTADFDPDPAVTNNLTAGGTADVFVSKLDASGNLVWARKLGGTSLDLGYGIALDATGNVYTTGTFAGTADFNPDAVATSNFTSAGFADVYVSKLDASGNYVWAKQMGGASVDEVYSIAVSASGVYTTGRFYTTADYNPDPAVTNNLTSFGADDIFISKLDASGNFVWVKQIGGTGSDYAASITVDALDNLYLTGYFTGTSDFDPDPAVNANLTAGGGSTDAFVVKLSQSGALPIQLSGFTGQSNRCTANITWTTATEQNTQYFEIQHSSDGINFTTIGTVPSSGNSNTEKHYSYSSNLVNQNNYFRLRTFDRDGSSKFSAVINVAGDCSSIITIYPNPAKNVITVNGLNGESRLRLLDQYGKMVRTIKTINYAETINLSGLPAGNYIMQVVEGNLTKNIKVIKE